MGKPPLPLLALSLLLAVLSLKELVRPVVMVARQRAKAASSTTRPPGAGTGPRSGGRR